MKQGKQHAPLPQIFTLEMFAQYMPILIIDFRVVAVQAIIGRQCANFQEQSDLDLRFMILISLARLGLSTNDASDRVSSGSPSTESSISQALCYGVRFETSHEIQLLHTPNVGADQLRSQ